MRHDYPMLESGSCDNGKDTYDKSVGNAVEQRSHDRSIRYWQMTRKRIVNGILHSLRHLR